MAKLYTLTEGDFEIFEKARKSGNPNYITDYYLKGENTGTWWNPGAVSDRWRLGYDTLLAVWIRENKPTSFVYDSIKYNVVQQADYDTPSFHNNHGFLFQPWQLDVFKARQRIRVIIGGYGCGKTVGGIAGMLERAAVLPGYRGLVLAPNSTMTGEVYMQALQLLYGTKYMDRFVIRTAEKPFPRITIGNSYVGNSNMIQFFPIGDSIGVDKILSLTIDEAFIDQAEQLMDIPDIIRAVGSRMRGMYQGRERLGRMSFSANSDFNDELWNIYDEAEDDPQRVLAISPKTWDNPFITDGQIVEIKKDVGNNQESIRVHMEGGRPVSGGEHFSAETLAKCKSTILDDLMNEARNNKGGFVFEQRNKVGVVKWALPPIPGRKYLVVADPGYNNPPNRNSPVIMVFDYTDFPTTPAALQAFYWVDGFNSPEPWLQKFSECVVTYDAYFSAAFDSTGHQAGYERLVPHLNDIQAVGMSMGGNNKFVYLNTAKRLAARGLFLFPSISGIFQQLSRYVLPDTGLKQDIVSCLLVAAGWLEHIFFSAMNDEMQTRTDFDPDDRYERDRNPRTSDRYSRSQNTRN